MTFDEAVDVLRVLSEVHADGTSWADDVEGFTADFYASTVEEYERVSAALLSMDEAASVVLAVLEDRSRR